MKATRLYLIRHGQVVGHDEYRYHGHTDVDITAMGVEQMNRLASFLSLAPIRSVYSSDLQRAVKGGRLIGRGLGLEPVMKSALREINLGRWEGLTREEAASRYPEEADFSFKDLATGRVKGGESLKDLRTRVMPAIGAIIEAHRGESVCVLAHGGVNRVILTEAMGLPIENFFRIEQDYGCLNVIDYFDESAPVVKLVNGGPNQELRPPVIY